MDYKIYDRLQASLGAIGDSFSLACQDRLARSDADENTKKLISEICVENQKALNELAASISDVLIAVTR